MLRVVELQERLLDRGLDLVGQLAAHRHPVRRHRALPREHAYLFLLLVVEILLVGVIRRGRRLDPPVDQRHQRLLVAACVDDLREKLLRILPRLHAALLDDLRDGKQVPRGRGRRGERDGFAFQVGYRLDVAVGFDVPLGVIKGVAVALLDGDQLGAGLAMSDQVRPAAEVGDVGVFGPKRLDDRRVAGRQKHLGVDADLVGHVLGQPLGVRRQRLGIFLRLKGEDDLVRRLRLLRCRLLRLGRLLARTLAVTGSERESQAKGDDQTSPSHVDTHHSDSSIEMKGLHTSS